jgi:hypothetical protein
MENVWTSKKLAKTLLGIKFEEALEGPENIIAGTNIQYPYFSNQKGQFYTGNTYCPYLTKSKIQAVKMDSKGHLPKGSYRIYPSVLAALQASAFQTFTVTTNFDDNHEKTYSVQCGYAKNISVSTEQYLVSVNTREESTGKCSSLVIMPDYDLNSAIFSGSGFQEIQKKTASFSEQTTISLSESSIDSNITIPYSIFGVMLSAFIPQLKRDKKFAELWHSTIEEMIKNPDISTEDIWERAIGISLSIDCLRRDSYIPTLFWNGNEEQEKINILNHISFSIPTTNTSLENPENEKFPFPASNVEKSAILNMGTQNTTNEAEYQDIKEFKEYTYSEKKGVFPWEITNRPNSSSQKKFAFGACRLNTSRKLTPLEEYLCDVKEDFVPTDTVWNIIQDIHGGARNIMIAGEPGTGKSTISRMVAYLLGVPHVILTCYDTMDKLSFTGALIPDVSVKGLPSDEEVLENPSCIKKFPATMPISEQRTEAMLFLAQLRKKARSKKTESENQTYCFVDTPFMSAIRNGWVVEVQEAPSIADGGVLPGIFGLLEEGVDTMPTGEVVHRHPESIVFFTNNVSGPGVQPLPKALIDRCQTAYLLNDVPDKDLFLRIKTKAAWPDDRDQELKDMISVVRGIQDIMRDHSITDGICGPRSLLNWAKLAKIGNPYNVALRCIINKCSQDAKKVAMCKEVLDASRFISYK